MIALSKGLVSVFSYNSDLCKKLRYFTYEQSIANLRSLKADSGKTDISVVVSLLSCLVCDRPMFHVFL